MQLVSGLSACGLGSTPQRRPVGIEDLHAERGGHVVAADGVGRHAVAAGGFLVGRRLVGFEFAFRIDRQAHRHVGLFRGERAIGFDAEGPHVFARCNRDTASVPWSGERAMPFGPGDAHIRGVVSRASSRRRT